MSQASRRCTPSTPAAETCMPCSCSRWRHGATLPTWFSACSITQDRWGSSASSTSCAESHPRGEARSTRIDGCTARRTSSMQPEPVISVVIPTWNRREDLARTLDVLTRHKGPPFEVIVVDNASTDGTATMVVASHPTVRLIRLPRNLGPTGARHVGVANANADIVVLLDSDTEPLEGAFEAIHRRLLEDPELAAVNALQIDAGTGQPWWWWGPHGYPQSEYLEREFDSAFKIEEGASGVRRSVFQEAGGFDERFFMLVEGRDLAARIVRSGYSIRYCPEVRFLHRAESNRPASNA